MTRPPCTDPDHLQIIERPARVNYCPVCGDPVSDDALDEATPSRPTADQDFPARLTELETSDERLRLAFEAGRIDLWELDLDSKESPIRSPRHDKLFGYDEPLDEWNFELFLEHVHPGDRQDVKQTFEEALETNRWEFECRINRDDGELRWIAAEGDFLFDDEGTAISAVGIVRDVTDVMEDSRLYEAIFNQTYQFTGLLEPDGTLIEANNSALKFGGVSREDVIGEKVWETHWFQISEETQQQTREDVERAASGEFVRHELEVEGTDEKFIIDFSIRPVTDDNGDVRYLIPEGRDITELKKREDELEEKSAWLETLYDKSPDMVDVINSEGRLLDVNRRFCDELGYEEDDLLGTPIWEIDQLVDAEDVQSLLSDFSVNERRRFEGVYRRRDGSTFPVEVHLLRLGGGGDDRFLAISRDISEQKKDEQQLQDALGAKERLMQEIHHRVKNNFQLASSILGLRSRGTDNEELKQILADLQSRFQSMVSLHRILYRQEDVNRVRMKAYLESIIETVQGNFGLNTGSTTVHRSLADVTLPPQTALICGLILTELLMDCFEHAMAGRDDGTISIRFNQTNGDLELKLEDDGPGFDEPLDELMAESLGLKLVKKLSIDQLGGTFTADGSDGASFRITIPQPE